MRYLPSTSKKGFTIIEIVISLLLFAMIMVFALQALANIGVVRIRTLSKVDLESELYYFSERLASLIKNGGTIDYEEYWNRKTVGYETASGHYIKPTGFGNYGSGGRIGTTTYGEGLYLCRSGNGTSMGTGGCLDSGNGTLPAASYSGVYQRYTQYKYHFIDYNGNMDNDGGDEDGVNGIAGDEDDTDLGEGPSVFAGAVKELYLYNPNRKERTFFRWNVKADPDAPEGVVCDVANAIGNGCLGNIEILKIMGKDYGENHVGTLTGAYDGVIDTWLCHPDWEGNCEFSTGSIAGQRIPTGAPAEWISLFPSSINVKNVEFRVYPNKDPLKGWASNESSIFIHPHVKFKLTLGLAWQKRKAIKNDNPEISISTTLSLTEF